MVGGAFKYVAFIAVLLSAYVLYNPYGNDEGSPRGKRVLVTGASTGIGEQIAYEYARQGARLVVTSRRESRLQEVTRKCRDVGNPDGQYEHFAADMSDVDSTKRLIDFANKTLGGLDVLVLNHMFILRDVGDWRGSGDNFTLLASVMRLNFESYVRLASHALPTLDSTNGSLVVISSLSGKLFQPYFLPYATSKFALNGFFGGLRQELKLRDSHVTVTVCTLGFIDTENAVTSLRRFGLTRLLKLQRTSPVDTAEAIVRGVSARADDVYVPYLSTRLVPLVREVFPASFDALMRYLYMVER